MKSPPYRAPGAKFPDRSAFLSAACLFAGPVGLFAPKGLTVLLVAAAVGVIAESLISRRPLMGRLDGWALYLLLFAALCALSAVWAIEPARTLRTAPSIIAVFFAGLVLVRAGLGLDREGAATLERFLIIGVLAALLLAVFELLTGAWISLNLRGLAGSPAELTGDAPKRLLNNGITVLALLTWPAVCLTVRDGRVPATILLAGLLIAAVYLAEADVGVTAVAIGGGAVLASGLLRRWIPAFVPALVVLAVVAAPLLMVSFSPLQRHVDKFPELSGSAYHRLLIWDATSGLIQDRPLLGHGFDASRALGARADRSVVEIHRRGEKVYRGLVHPLPLHPHNMALQIWLELGLAGLLYFFGLIAALVISVWRMTATPIARDLFLGMLVSGTVVAFTAYGAWQNWWQSALWICAMAMAFSLKRSSEK